MYFSDYLINKINSNKNTNSITFSLISLSLGFLLGGFSARDDPKIFIYFFYGFFVIAFMGVIYSFYGIFYSNSLTSISDFIILNDYRINKTTKAYEEILLIFRIGLFLQSKKVIKKIEFILDKHDNK